MKLALIYLIFFIGIGALASAQNKIVKYLFKKKIIK